MSTVTKCNAATCTILAIQQSHVFDSAWHAWHLHYTESLAADFVDYLIQPKEIALHPPAFRVTLHFFFPFVDDGGFA